MAYALARGLLDAEIPILERHRISMWGYAVLSSLDDQPTRTQAALAEAIGADKTRIIPVLEELQRRGLIDRTPDPADRRARLLSLTPAGRELRDAARSEIRAREDDLLAQVAEPDRESFLRVLRQLSALPRHEIAGAP